MLLMSFMFYRAYSPKNDENSRAFCESAHARISSISIDLLEKFQATNERTESALNQYFLRGYTERYIQWRIHDFPEEGAPTPRGGRQHTILPNFPKNCMKLKEFGPGGGVQNFTM